MRQLAINKLMITAIVAGLTLFSSGCHGRKVRAELVEFASTLESTRSLGNELVEKLAKMKLGSPDEAPELEAQINELVVQIDSILKPVKALNPQTEEVRDLKNLYLSTWTSLRDAINLVARVIRTRDEKLAMTLDTQLMARMKSYDQIGMAFERSYQELTQKYNITIDELGFDEPPPQPVSDFPLTPSQ